MSLLLIVRMVGVALKCYSAASLAGADNTQ